MKPRNQLWRLCQAFIAKYEISCPEVLCQVTTVVADDYDLTDAYDFIKAICEIVGYYRYEPEPETPAQPHTTVDSAMAKSFKSEEIPDAKD